MRAGLPEVGQSVSVYSSALDGNAKGVVTGYVGDFMLLKSPSRADPGTDLEYRIRISSIARLILRPNQSASTEK